MAGKLIKGRLVVRPLKSGPDCSPMHPGLVANQRFAARPCIPGWSQIKDLLLANFHDAV